MSAKDYNINFFTPKSGFMQSNSRLISVMVITWVLAVFGFQTLLKITESPVPEPQYHTFKEISAEVKSGTISTQSKLKLLKINLNLLTRYIPLRSNESLKKLTTVLINDLLPESARGELQTLISEKGNASASMLSALQMSQTDLLAPIIPYSLTSIVGNEVALNEVQTKLDFMDGIVAKYMIHNRSALTDTKILGFPFHYLYTSEILLIIFVLICLVYCLVFQKIVEKHGVE
ncbi:MAG: DUF4212 domain-containing protein [Bacteriovoracaceae bacterium]|nr:DUF4212 domain-containing protein [Bacteriovoracaceae bacterium]